MNQQPTHVVVIPAYNEAATIADIARRARAVAPTVIVVDDGSVDNTAAQLAGLPVELIRHTHNQGKAASLWHGMQRALECGAECVITLDGDGQHAPEDIPDFLNAARDCPRDIIIGARLADKHAIPRKRYIANKIANFWISWAAGHAIEDSQSGFRLYPAQLLRQLRVRIDRQKSFVFESEVLIKAARLGYRSRALRIPAVYYPQARPSHFRGGRDIARITRMVAGELLSHGMNLPGFYRAFIRPRLQGAGQGGLDRHALITLALSVLVMLVSGFITYVLVLARIIVTAATTASTAPGAGTRIVPGVQLLGDAIPADYRRRLDRALASLSEQPRARVLLLGGKGGGATRSEARAGHDYLTARGVDTGRIQLEETSRNTLENLREARRLLPAAAEPGVLITNRYHLQRCHSYARGFALAHHLCAAEPAFRLNPHVLRRLLIEAFHLHWYFAGKTLATVLNNQAMLQRIR